MRRIALTIAFALATTASAVAAPFTVTAPLFADNGSAPLSASAPPPCGPGTSISPALSIANAPATTKSFAIVVYDPDAGTFGGGIWHWIAYGIPATMTSIPENFGQETQTGYVHGTNTLGKLGFQGFCPPAGDNPHHYNFTVYATSLEPTALAPGMTKEQLTAALKGHIVAGATTVGRYARL